MPSMDGEKLATCHPSNGRWPQVARQVGKHLLALGHTVAAGRRSCDEIGKQGLGYTSLFNSTLFERRQTVQAPQVRGGCAAYPRPLSGFQRHTASEPARETQFQKACFHAGHAGRP